MIFEEAQAKVETMIRGKVSGFDGNLSYVRYFKDQAEVEAFETETGYLVEILNPA